MISVAPIALGTIFSQPLKHMIYGAKRSGWTASFETAVEFLRRILVSGPDDVNLARKMTDMSIPGVLLPSHVHRFKERVMVSDGSYMKCEWVWPYTDKGMRRVLKSLPESHYSLIKTRPVFLYVHGGGFSLCSTGSHRSLLMNMAHYCNMAVYAPNYRRPPEVAMKDAIADVILTLDRMVNHYQVPIENIVIAGDSAGGSLACLTLLELKRLNRPLPGLAVLLCPWVDLSSPGDTEHAEFDYLPISKIAYFASLAAGSLELHDSRVSPTYGDLRGFPPTLIHAGEAEILNSQIKRFAEKLEEQGVPVELRVWKDMVHVFHMFTNLHETPTAAFHDIRAFIDQRTK